MILKKKGRYVLETGHLRCFVAVAEELHFRRAARRLNMTQPPLTRQIQLLEHTMKCELFTRNSRTVRLTHAGKVFLPEAQRILRIMEAATSSAQEVAAGRKGGVRCGFTASAAYEFLPRLVSKLHLELPDVALSLSEMVSRDQSDALVSGEIEIGLLRVLRDLADFKHRKVASEELMLALPIGHPLCEKDKVKWGHLHRERFIGYNPRLGQYFYKLVSSKLTLEGVEPTLVQELTQIHSLLALVRSGTGIAVVPECAQTIASQGVEYRAFDDPKPTFSELFVVWQPESHNPLVSIIGEIAEACGTPEG